MASTSGQSGVANYLSDRWLAAARATKENPQGSAVRYNSCVATVSQSVRVKVLFFGRLKDIVGQSEAFLDLADASSIEELFARYCTRIPGLAKYRSSVVASRNQEFVAWDTAVYPGDEVAFLPPVSGG
jgi:sulfur-carrier protein